eukprot:1156293-Pelagomonas_calceolata.AAC.1
MGIWKVSRSTRLQNLAARSMIVFNNTPSGNKLVGVHNRVGMKLASKFNDTLMVKSTGLHAATVLPPTVVQAMITKCTAVLNFFESPGEIYHRVWTPLPPLKNFSGKLHLSSFSACLTSLSLNFVVWWSHGLCTNVAPFP